MTKPHHILLAALSMLIALCTLSAPAQAQDDPRQILLDSAQALQDTPGFSAKATLSGEGSKMILSTLPSMTGRITIGQHSEYGKVIHLLGQLTPTAQAAPEDFDILYSADRYIWSDHPNQTLNIRPPSVSGRIRPTAFSYLLLAELIKDQPFQSELDNAVNIALEEQQSIAGTPCHVILIDRAKPQGRAAAGAHNKERWFIGVEDNLPRRVEQITDASMIRASLIMELTGLSIAPPSDTDLEVFVPDTYKVIDNIRKQQPKVADRDKPFNKPTQPTTTPTPQPVVPQTPTDPPAPNYNFTDTNNQSISRSTQTGRITVLYFHGSWSIPSKQATPLLSDLTRSFDNPAKPIDTFAIAIRESDPATVEDDHINNNYAHHLAINPSNSLAALFQVRVYPTVIVIDDNNRITYRNHMGKDTDAQALIDGAKDAINKALNPAP
jgi:thiol-disulfide isomerase/thioredoxin